MIISRHAVLTKCTAFAALFQISQNEHLVHSPPTAIADRDFRLKISEALFNEKAEYLLGTFSQDRLPSAFISGFREKIHELGTRSYFQAMPQAARDRYRVITAFGRDAPGPLAGVPRNFFTLIG